MQNNNECKTVSWFSAGISSFVAAYIMRDKLDEIIYIDVANQHPDSMRFVRDCERLLDMPITILRDTRYGASVDNVIEQTRYINSPYGANCTMQLKKRVRQDWERENNAIGSVYVWGYDVGEVRRAKRMRETMPEYKHAFPLIDASLSKADCHGLAMDLGLKRPIMYDLGYPNNNCIGCVKGGRGYWNKIREDFPDVFKRRAKQERLIGHSCINGVYLDELEPNTGNMNTEIMPDCSIMCYLLEQEL